MARGRPREHDRVAIVTAVCEQISNGALVKDACKEAGITTKSLREWTRQSELGALYARAREEQASAFAEQALSIAHGNDEDNEARVAQMVEAVHGADEADKRAVLNALLRESVQRDRLRVDTLKWTASKLAPRLYGEKLQQEHSGGVTVKLEYVEGDE